MNKPNTFSRYDSFGFQWQLTFLLFALFVVFASTAIGLVEFDNFFPGIKLTSTFFQDSQGNFRLPEVAGSFEFLLLVGSGILLSILLPSLTPIGASLLVAVLAVIPVGIAIANPYRHPPIPFQFSLLVLLILYGINVLMQYFMETQERHRLLSTFAQFVPPQIVGLLNDQTSKAALEGESKFLTVFFCDLRNFTGMSEQLDPKEIVKLLNDYFTIMTSILHEKGATIDKYIGDSIMAFWGAPLPQEDHIKLAVQASFEMHKRMHELSAIFHSRGLPTPSIGIGINSGIMNVGNMGSKYRLAYTVIGDSVNLAFRLQTATREYLVPTIVGQGTESRCPEMVFRELDTVAVKGKIRETRIYEPICLQTELTDTIRIKLEAHQKALNAWYNQDRNLAKELFSQLAIDYPQDSYYGVMMMKATERRGQKPDSQEQAESQSSPLAPATQP